MENSLRVALFIRRPRIGLNYPISGNQKQRVRKERSRSSFRAGAGWSSRHRTRKIWAGSESWSQRAFPLTTLKRPSGSTLRPGSRFPMDQWGQRSSKRARRRSPYHRNNRQQGIYHLGRDRAHERAMPRQSKGARLVWRKENRKPDGKLRSNASWYIEDNGRRISTGCGRNDLGEAEKRLQSYLAEKHTPSRQRNRDPDQVKVADVIIV